MLKSFVFTALRRAGYQIVRRPRDTYHLHSRFSKRVFDDTMNRVRQITMADDSSGRSWRMAKRYMTARRASFYYEVLEKMERAGIRLDGETVLDVGTYYGQMLSAMHAYYPGGNYFGIEPGEKAFQLAIELCPFATIRSCGMDELNKNEKYDVVLLQEVLEHLAKPERAVQTLWAHTNKNLVLTVPNGRFDCLPALAYYEAHDCYRGHVNFWSPESWSNWLSRQVSDCRLHTGELPTGQLYAILERTNEAA